MAKHRPSDSDLNSHGICFASMIFVVVFCFVAVSWQTLLSQAQEPLSLVSDPLPGHDDRFALHPDDEPWTQIEPSRKIIYHDCFDGLQCARLLLPLDWSGGASKTPAVAIALIRRPAKVNVTDPRYGGALIFNPGGPSASGVETVIRIGARLQNTIDVETYPTAGSHNTPPGAQYFDVISFDPRGVNHTLPQLNCFPDPLHRLVWSLAADTEGLIGAASTSFDQRWSRFVSRSKACTSVIQDQGDDSIAYYMGRRSVVDDIVAIAEHHGQWRGEEARRLLLDPELPTMGLTSAQIIANTRWRRSEEPVLFWGTSYGTVLGSTLAAMYPGRIKRMILDSVLSPTYSIYGHTDTNLIHADEIFTRFVQLCYKHGPEKCQAYRDSEEEISQMIFSVLSDLMESPLAVGATMTRGPDVITEADLKRLIAGSLYQPRYRFPLLASILQDLVQGNGSSFADYKAKSKALSVADVLAGRYNVSPRCKADGPYSPACSRPNEWLEESLLGISCGDGVAPGNATKDDFLAYWYGMRNQSSSLGDVWSEWDMMCMGWGAKTKWAFNGQFGLFDSERSC
ncbi:unnamed protein product [Alternaria alternata]